MDRNNFYYTSNQGHHSNRNGYYIPRVESHLNGNNYPPPTYRLTRESDYFNNARPMSYIPVKNRRQRSLSDINENDLLTVPGTSLSRSASYDNVQRYDQGYPVDRRSRHAPMHNGGNIQNGYLTPGSYHSSGTLSPYSQSLSPDNSRSAKAVRLVPLKNNEQVSSLDINRNVRSDVTNLGDSTSSSSSLSVVSVNDRPTLQSGTSRDLKKVVVLKSNSAVVGRRRMEQQMDYTLVEPPGTYSGTPQMMNSAKQKGESVVLKYNSNAPSFPPSRNNLPMDGNGLTELIERARHDPGLAQQLLSYNKRDHQQSLDLYKLIQDGKKIKEISRNLSSQPSSHQTQIPYDSYISNRPNSQAALMEGRPMRNENMRPSVAPKPLLNPQYCDRVVDINQYYSDSPHLGHHKSDSVDSSDGLRKSRHQQYHAQSYNSYDGGESFQNREYRRHKSIVSEKSSPPPTPPPRSYKLVSDRGNNPILVPESHLRRPNSRSSSSKWNPRYGSNSSINQVDYGSMNLVDYRTNLSSIKSTLPNDKFYSNSNTDTVAPSRESEAICDCQPEKGAYPLSSRTPSMSSIRSSHGKTSNGSAKNALLKEKLMGPRISSSKPPMNPSSYSPMLSKSSSRTSIARKETSRSGSARNHPINIKTPPPHPFSDSSHSEYRADKYKRSSMSHEDYHQGSAKRQMDDNYKTSGTPQSDATPSTDMVDNAIPLSPSKVSLLANKFNSAIKETESQYQRAQSPHIRKQLSHHSVLERSSSRPSSVKSARTPPEDLSISRQSNHPTEQRTSSEHSVRNPLLTQSPSSSRYNIAYYDDAKRESETKARSKTPSGRLSRETFPIFSSPTGAGTLIKTSASDSGIGNCLEDKNGSDKLSPPPSSNQLLYDRQKSVSPISGNSVPPTPYGSPVFSSPSEPESPVTREEGVTQPTETECRTDVKLSRGLSVTSEKQSLVCKARNELTQGIWDRSNNTSDDPSKMEMTKHTFMLPDLSIYEASFRRFIESDLIELSTLQSLEQSGRLNWWKDTCQRLWPLATTGDGNCLLHAASLGMWGFHDRRLALRSSLHNFLKESYASTSLWRRWRWHTLSANAITGLVYSDSEWDSEWSSVLRLASTEPRHNGGSSSSHSSPQGGKKEEPVGGVAKSGSEDNSDASNSTSGTVYESLEEVHILALAHVLRRPIIVVADKTLKDVHGAPLSPIPFGGVYLPLEFLPEECQRSPLLLTYDAAHFSALVVMEPPQEQEHIPAVIPLTTSSHSILPIHFAVDPGDDFVWEDKPSEAILDVMTLSDEEKVSLLHQYLDVAHVPKSGGPVVFPEPENALESQTSPMDVKSSGSSGNESESEDSRLTQGTMSGRKQRNTISKQFGTLSRSMSKRIKKNFGKMGSAKTTGSVKRKGNDSKYSARARQHNYILGAALHTEKRLDYQEEMVSKYLKSARVRFEESKEKRKLKNEGGDSNAKSSISSDAGTLTPPSSSSSNTISLLPNSVTSNDNDDNASSKCINPGCSSYGTASTSYMCQMCYDKQRKHEQQHEMSRNRNSGSKGSGKEGSQHSAGKVGKDGAQYGAGKSHFYAELNSEEVKSSSIPSAKSIDSKRDSTLFLSNSTFFNDANGSKSAKSSKREKSKREQTISIGDREKSLCRREGCEFFGSEYNEGYCSKCNSTR